MPLLNSENKTEKCQPDKPFDSCPSNFYCHSSPNTEIDHACCSKSGIYNFLK